MKYYIKDNLVFSALTTKIKIIDKVDEIEIPASTKNHLINNKILITDIEKVLKSTGRNFEISKPIENFEEIKKSIKENKSKLKKVTSNDYDFIEKTSQLDIIKSILSSVENSNINELSNKINLYIENNKEKELQKNTEIDESIQIEKNKIIELKNKKEEVYTKSSVKKLELLEIEKKNIEKEIEKKEYLIKDYSSLENRKLESIKKRQEKIINETQDLKFKIKINKNKIKSLKAKLKLGKTKQFNWITGILLIFTLGLIYWSRFTDTKYYILKLEERNAKYEEKLSELEHEKFNLEKDTREVNKKHEQKSVENSKKESELRTEIDNLNIKIDKINKDILEIENEIKKEDSKINEYDKDISKIETKILDLESTKKEFEKYSTAKIAEKLNLLVKLKEDKIKELNEISDKIKTQKIDIIEEFIFEI